MAQKTDKPIKFGYGKLATVLGKLNTADGMISFGNYVDDAGSQGCAIVANGKLVSSKIQDITTAKTFTSNRTLNNTAVYVAGTKESLTSSDLAEGQNAYGFIWGVKTTITVTYIDVTESGTNKIKTLTFEAVDETAATRDNIEALQTLLAQTDNIQEKVVNTGEGVTLRRTEGAVDVSVDASGTSTKYFIGTKVDNATILIDPTTDVLKSGLSLKYYKLGEDATHTGIGENIAQGKTARLVLEDANQNELYAIDANKFAGGGMLNRTSYNKVNNILTLIFKDANGDDLPPVEIDMQELIDINDIFIGSESQKYLKVSLDTSVATFDTSMLSLSNATETTTGLVDAWDAKHYIDTSIQNLDSSVHDADNTKGYVTFQVVEKDGKLVQTDGTDSTFIEVTYGTFGSQNAVNAESNPGKLVDPTVSGIATVEAVTAAINSTAIFVTDDSSYINAIVNADNNKRIDVSLDYGAFTAQNTTTGQLGAATPGLATAEGVTAAINNASIYAAGDGTYVFAATNANNNKRIDVTVTYGSFRQTTATFTTGTNVGTDAAGFAKAEDVKDYVEDKLTWIDLDANEA